GHSIEGEAVASVYLKARGVGEARSSCYALQLAGNACGIAFESALTVGAGVQFDDVGADALGGFDGGGIRLDEQRDADAGGLQVADDTFEASPAARNVEATFRRAFLAPLGNEAARVWQMAQRNGEHLVGCRHLKIEMAATDEM